jgi:hypothetical protein
MGRVAPILVQTDSEYPWIKLLAWLITWWATPMIGASCATMLLAAGAERWAAAAAAALRCCCRHHPDDDDDHHPAAATAPPPCHRWELRALGAVVLALAWVGTFTLIIHQLCWRFVRWV